MFLKYVFLACVLCTVSRAALFDKPKTNIYYETLDQNSIDFFRNKFIVYYKNLNSFVDFNLVPFGKAKLTKNGPVEVNITCEHGEVECYGNRVHACALEHLTSTDEKIEFVVCTMNHTNPKNVTKENYPAKKCIQLLNLAEFTIDDLDVCIARESTKLLEKYDNETKHLQTNIDVLPVITLNEEPFDAQMSADLVKNFQEAVCQKLTDVPAAAAICGNNNSSTTVPPHSTTTHGPNSATSVSTSYWPLFVAIVLTVLFEVNKLRY